MRTHRRYATVIAIAALAVIGLSIVFGRSATSQSIASTYYVSFQSTVPDLVVLQITQANRVSPTAVLTWTAGLSGSHRSPADSTMALVATARAESIQAFSQGLTQNSGYINAFLRDHPLDEVRASSVLQTQGRSLLTIRSQLSLALAATSRGDPLVYGVTLTNPTAEQVASLSHDLRIRSIQSLTDNRGAADIKPAAYQVEYRDAVIEGLSADEIVARMANAVGGR